MKRQEKSQSLTYKDLSVWNSFSIGSFVKNAQSKIAFSNLIRKAKQQHLLEVYSKQNLCSVCLQQVSRLHEVLRNEQLPWKPSPRPVQQLRRRRRWRQLWQPRAHPCAMTSVRRQWPPAPPPMVGVFFKLRARSLWLM